MQVLIVDDDDFALSVVENIMMRFGYTAVTARNGVEALEILRTTEIRLVITDWDMPEMNGVDFCRAVRREDLSGYVYVIMLTGREGAQQRMQGLCAGADDFLNKPLDPDELLVCLKTAERILALETRDLALFALAKLAESRDSETGAHVERVQSYSRLIARNLSDEIKAQYGVDEDYVRLLYQTSPLHDLGKVGIPDSILLKPGKLSPEEFKIMQTHTVVGAQTLDAALSRFPNARFLQLAREIAATHHERFDGSGYPKGLAGEQIPLCGRIVAVADVYDALTSRRVYKAAMAHEQAREIILRDRGSHFDPEVVNAFLRAEKLIIAVRERLSDVPPPPSEPVLIPELPVVNEAASNPCPILVVDDDPLLRARLVELLSVTGEPIISASDGEEATRLLIERSPRVVLSDWVMPKSDGVELCRRIRARGGESPVHFIMMTTHSEKSRLLEAYDAGVDDFVVKPFDHEELLARLRAGIRAARLHDDLVRRASGSQALNAELATLNSRLERLAITDELTGLFNRRHALTRLGEQWELFTRYGRALTVAMIDIDHFKSINDTRGHGVGDAILRRVSGILRDQTRGTDVVCRVGGEEFLILFPSQTVEEAGVCAERCRSAVAKHVFDIGGVDIRASVSIGLACRAGDMKEFPELLQAADEALYAAKRGGRNRVCRSESKSQPTAAATAGPVAPAMTASSEPSIAAPQASQRAPIDRSAILLRCGGDATFAAAVTERFRSQSPGEVARIQSALAAGDPDAVRRIAHSLKSMCAYVSADVAAKLASQIEEMGTHNQLPAVSPLLAQLQAEIDRSIQWITTDSQTSARCA
jgi:putative two-component system response regulator